MKRILTIVFACHFFMSCSKTETKTTTTTPITPTAPSIALDTVLAGKINQTPVFQFQG